MCTVTYLPTRSGFTLTHNRDEAPARSLYAIEAVRNEEGDTLIFPRDAKAGGTWIAVSRSGKTACLLNGAFIKHHHEPPYRRSRGLMLLDFFRQEPARFFERYELDGIEPFTFLYFNGKEAVEFRWDGTRSHYKELPVGEPHFWCSSTLYPPEMQVKREQIFRNWLAETRQPRPQNILHLHRSGSVGDPANDYVMERERVRTVSVTQVVFRKNFARMRYLDLLEGNRDERLVSLKDW